MKLNIQYFADGKVVIDTDLNTKGFENGLSKMSGIAKRGFGIVATSTAAAAGAVTTLMGASVKAAGDLEQQIGGTEAVFGKFADTVQDKAAKAFDKMGVSANDYMATANKMGALMQGSGLSIEKSMDLSSKAMQRAADVASVMGISTEDAMTAIAGAAKGNFTMMDNLGVAMNATSIQAYAMSKGIKTSYNEMDQATKVGLAMEMFLEKTAYAEGNYAKENETFAGSFSTLKAATSNFLSGAGGIQDVAKAMAQFGQILVESINEMASQILEGIQTLVDKLIPEIPTLIESLLPTVVASAMSLINGLAEIFPAIMTMIQENLPTIVQGALTIIKTLTGTILKMLPQILQMGIYVIVELAKGLAQALPELIPQIVDAMLLMVDVILDNIDLIIDAGIQIILALIDGIIAALPQLIEKIPEIIWKIVKAIFENLPKIFEAGVEIIKKLLSGIFSLVKDVIQAGWDIVKNLASGLLKGVGNVVKAGAELTTNLLNKITGGGFGKMLNAGKDLVGKLRDGLKGGISGIIDVGKNLISGLWDGIKKKWEGLKNKVNDFGKGIVGKFKSVFGIKSPSRIFRDEIGKYLAEGIGVGFDDEIDSVYRDMQKAIDLNTDKMSANVQTNGTYQMAMAGLPEFNLLDNTENTTQLVVNGKILAEVVNTENKYREVAKA